MLQVIDGWLLVAATGSSRKKALPWTSFIQQPQDYLEPEHLPNDLSLRDPSKLHSDELDSIIAYWWEHQNRDLPPIQFKAILVKGKLTPVSKIHEEFKIFDLDNLIPMGDDDEVEADNEGQ